MTLIWGKVYTVSFNNHPRGCDLNLLCTCVVRSRRLNWIGLDKHRQNSSPSWSWMVCYVCACLWILSFFSFFLPSSFFLLLSPSSFFYNFLCRQLSSIPNKAKSHFEPSSFWPNTWPEREMRRFWFVNEEKKKKVKQYRLLCTVYHSHSSHNTSMLWVCFASLLASCHQLYVVLYLYLPTTK